MLGPIKDLKIIPWEDGCLGVSYTAPDGIQYSVAVPHHVNCFFVSRIAELEGRPVRRAELRGSCLGCPHVAYSSPSEACACMKHKEFDCKPHLVNGIPCSD